MAKSHRPLVITILAVLYLLSALSAFVTGYAAGGPVGLLAGVIPLIIFFGFFRGWSIMWYVGVIFSVIALIGSLMTISTGVAVVPLILNLIILIYLFKPNVRSFFLH